MSECDLMPLRGGPASSGQTQIESETNRTKKNKIKTKVMTRCTCGASVMQRDLFTRTRQA